jgi:hypothetical protein
LPDIVWPAARAARGSSCGLLPRSGSKPSACRRQAAGKIKGLQSRQVSYTYKTKIRKPCLFQTKVVDNFAIIDMTTKNDNDGLRNIFSLKPENTK